MKQTSGSLTPGYIYDLSRSLCKIIIGNTKGSGFFMKSKNIKKGSRHFLVTNFHIISDDIINSKQAIEIHIEYIREKIKIQLDNETRFIRCFPKPLDITIIEILKTDKLKNTIRYLKIDNLHDKEYKAYLSKDIYILHHPKGGPAECSLGKILNINDNTFQHDAFTEEGSSGSPIILVENLKIIGIHCGKNIIKNLNCGVFIEKINDINAQRVNVIFDKDKEKLNIYSDFDSAPPLKEGIQIINLRYKYSNSKILRIFGDIFALNNKHNCKILVGDKEYNLKGKMALNKMEKIGDEYEIKLIIKKGLNNLSHMFYQCNSLSPSSEINKINTSNTTNISHLFLKCEHLSELPDISEWDTGKVENMELIFGNCQSLLSLPDISKWNTSKVQNMMGIFSFCTSLLSLPDISKWDTKEVCKMDFMFYRCDLLESIPDISKWDTKNVIDMTGMFEKCYNLLYLPDISSWKTSKVEYIPLMFADCQKLKRFPDLSSWDIRNVKSFPDLFRNLISVERPIKFPKLYKD